MIAVVFAPIILDLLGVDVGYVSHRKGDALCGWAIAASVAGMAALPSPRS